MNTRLAILSSFLFWTAGQHIFSAEPITIRSQSGQFLVRGLPLATSLASLSSTSGVSYVRLDPTLVSVSCERIKHALLQALKMNDQWRSPVYVSLHPVRHDDESIVVTSMRYTDGWSYRINTPEQVDKTRYLQAVVQVLLLELANRHKGPHAAELPPWLAEGMAAHLQATAAINLLVEPDTRIARKEQNLDPLAAARAQLRAQRPLTLNELSWPGEAQRSAEGAAIYRSCAHLFVHELLRLKNGPELLREMMARLPDHLNWQIAFMRAFQAYFPRLVDADKWWMLSVVHVTGRDLMSVWPREESLRRLDEILNTTVQLRMNPKELPLFAEVRLQTLISEWNHDQQVPVLSQKVNQLKALRLRTIPELGGLTDTYRQTLENYLQRSRKATAGMAPKNQPMPSARLIVHDTINRLNELDTQRDWHRKKMGTQTAAGLPGKP